MPETRRSYDSPPKRLFGRHRWWTLPGRCLIALFRGYQYLVSPLFPPTCRFVPTCSQYAIEAVAKYGAVRGTLLALWRIARCHPFSRGGYDPVR
ncbi:MAG: membrane protein insertion efficiency factor YidD [Desulfobulbus sp.]|nr:membrane protein insertion efficiency factor YidD [Desulfobulbus sp.]MDR2550612.1 membrane protein insertion efficiency factor YidD [Desulfobulbus sp.]